MRLYLLAYVAGLLPLLTINLTYLLAADAGQVAWCIPYLDSCTSISATGRSPPASFVFKGLMIPAALLLMLYWLLNANWLLQLGCSRRHWHCTLAVLGLLSGPGLIFHSLLLGEAAAEYRQARHMGVMVFCGCTFFAQVLLTWLIQRLPALKAGWHRRLLWLRVVLLLDLLVGLANVLTGWLSPSMYEAFHDAFAWHFILLLCLHVILTADLWRQTGYRLMLGINSPR